MIWIYFFIAFAILALAIAYTILLFREDSKKKDTKKTSKIKSGQDTKSALSKLHPNKGHIKLSDEDAGRYIVAAVGIVGFIAILMIIIG
jgi:Flp pilus assembly protein TadB